MNTIVIKDRLERQSRIQDESKASIAHHSMQFRGTQRTLKVIRIPIDFPLYRLQNGRTRVKQMEYMRENQLPAEFFSSSEENLETQIAQHKILLGMSKDAKGDIYQELARVGRQTENLLLTGSGVIVNGNRRVAAMRELYASDPHTFAKFAHLDAVILPAEATSEDIETIEAELQLVPEAKLAYGWIERLLSLRHKLEDIKMPRTKIKEIFRFTREEDINIELGQLSLAEQYLDEYLQKPFFYEEVEQGRQLFKDLQAELSGKSGQDAEMRRAVGFLLVKESRNLGARAYDFKSAFGKDFAKFREVFAKCNGISISAQSNEQSAFNLSGGEDESDPLSGLLEMRNNIQPLIDILSDQAKTAETAETVASVMGSIKSSQREGDAKNAAFKAVQEALRKLNSVDLTKADPATFTAMLGQLDGVLKLARDLRTKLENLEPK